MRNFEEMKALKRSIGRQEPLSLKEMVSCSECLAISYDLKFCIKCGKKLCKVCRNDEEKYVFCFKCNYSGKEG